MITKEIKTDVLIIGGGLAGIVTALELLDTDLHITLLDRDKYENFGGLAKESFGGIFFVNSPTQRRMGISDNKDLALSDWYSFADFEEDDVYPKMWAEQYISLCTSEVHDWLKQQGISFFPVIHWVERGLYKPGNSVPRFHMVWGTGHELATRLIKNLNEHPNTKNLDIRFNHRIKDLSGTQTRITGASGVDELNNNLVNIESKFTVIATGGIGGSNETIRKFWNPNLGQAPEKILNGAHEFGLGDLHWAAEKMNANITHLNKMWNYAAGIHHPFPQKPNHGLSVVPPKSALWVNAEGYRIGPVPLVAGYDTSYLVESVCKQADKYSWQIMNWKIAKKEMAVSGSEYNDAIKNKNWIGFISGLLFGNKALLNSLKKDCVDFVMADSIELLVEKMNALNGDNKVNLEILKKSISFYDNQIGRGKKYFNDEQLRRIVHLRQYRGDRIRTCNFQKIDDNKVYPLVAIREFILSRKSLGGIQTDLDCQVLNKEGNSINGLLAIGEAAGFGGGGMHGRRALEGTFLGSCILAGRIAARTIRNGK